MAKAVIIEDIKRVMPILLSMPSKRIWVSYDDETDVLYFSFEKPQKATDSEQIDDAVIRYRGKDVVGVTIINANRYVKSKR